MSAETDYLRARYDEEEADARTVPEDGYPTWVLDPQYDHHDHTQVLWISPRHVLADLAAKRKILDFDDLWPVLIGQEPKVEVEMDKTVFAATVRLVSQMNWMTHLDYQKRFGKDAPTTLIIRALLQPYAARNDFDPAWRD